MTDDKFLKRHEILKMAASIAWGQMTFKQVLAEADPAIKPIEFLHVWDSGFWVIHDLPPEFMRGDNNTSFACAPVGNYASVDALIAALGESVKEEE